METQTTIKEVAVDVGQLKKARGLRSINEVSKALNLTRQQVWNYENGTSEPPVSTLVKLADLYGVRVEKFIVQKNLTKMSNLT